MTLRIAPFKHEMCPNGAACERKRKCTLRHVHHYDFRPGAVFEEPLQGTAPWISYERLLLDEGKYDAALDVHKTFIALGFPIAPAYVRALGLGIGVCADCSTLVASLLADMPS